MRSHTLQRSLFVLLALAGTMLILATPAPAAAPWVAEHDSGLGHDRAYAVAIDSNGDFIAAGYTRGAADYDCYAIRYDAAGNELAGGWPIQVDNEFPIDNDGIHATCVDSADNVIFAGYLGGSGTPYYNKLAVWKYDPAGTEVFSYSTYMYDHNVAYGVCADNADNIYVIGLQWRGTSYRYDWAIRKLDPSGVVQPGFPIYYDHGGGYEYRQDLGYDIAVDDAGNMIAVGTQGISGSNSSNMDVDWHVRKLDPSGALIWSDSYAGPGGRTDYPKKVVVDGNGDIIVAGNANQGPDNSSNIDYDWLVIKYDGDGDGAGGAVRLWTHTFASAPGRHEGAFSLALDQFGNVWVGGWELFADNSRHPRLEYLSNSTGNLIQSQTWEDFEGLIYGLDHRDGALAITGRKKDEISGIEEWHTSHYWETVSAEMTCDPTSGTVPFTSQMSITLDNCHDGFTRRIAGRIDMELANGQFYSNWRTGYTNIAGGGSYLSNWAQNFPALATVIGDNIFTLVAEDVTPAPYNQAPHPPAGSVSTASGTVTGISP